MADLDQSGNAWQRARTYLGPTLGWADVQVRPTRTIVIAGTYQVFAGDSVIFVNVAGLVTLLLPDVRLWIQEPANQPATGFERAVWIKDLGGNAASFPITIAPFSGQTIDLLGTPFQVVVNRQLIRLYPLNDQTGWWVG